MILLVVVGLIMAILAVLFAFQNAAVVTINFGVWQLEQSLAIILISTLGLGIIISILLSLPTILKRGWQNSRQKNKIAQLQTQIKSNNQMTFQQQQQSLAQQQATQELLQAFSLSDAVTGLLNKNAAVELTEHLLHQLKTQQNNPRYAALIVMLIAIEPEFQRHQVDLGKENAVYKAISKRLVNAIDVDSFLGITERKRFISLTLGLRGAKVTEYAAYLQEKVTDSSLQKADGSLLPLKMSVGGIIVDPTDVMDARSVLKQAEQNLEKSLKTGGGTLEISEANLKTL